MARQVVWLTAALAELDSIAEYISADSPVYAAAVIRRIVAETRRIQQFPDAGRMVPEWGDPHVRERFVYSYRLIYRIQATEIQILATVHGARMLDEDVRDRGS